jgi:hypothetical protein
LVHRRLQIGNGISLFARIRLAARFSNELLAAKDTKALWRGNTAQCGYDLGVL